MTAHVSSESEAEILDCGIDHFMAKPLKRDVLAEQIEAAKSGPVRAPVAAE